MISCWHMHFVVQFFENLLFTVSFIFLIGCELSMSSLWLLSVIVKNACTAYAHVQYSLFPCTLHVHVLCCVHFVSSRCTMYVFESLTTLCPCPVSINSSVWCESWNNDLSLSAHGVLPTLYKPAKAPSCEKEVPHNGLFTSCSESFCVWKEPFEIERKGLSFTQACLLVSRFISIPLECPC